MLDLESLRARCRAGETFRYLHFWGHAPSPKGELTRSCLSQWYAAPFDIDGVRYPTAEHWMMAAKARLFGDSATLARILEAPDPRAAKALGRKVAGFDDAAWVAARRRLVTDGNVAKFGHDAGLRAFLLATGDAVLVEASPADHIWGIGLAAKDERAKHPDTWLGLNLLGFALMDVREALR